MINMIPLPAIRRFLIVLLLAGSVSVFCSCGYRMGGAPCDAFPSARTVGVPLFQNRSHEPHAEDLFTEAFRESVRSIPCMKLRPSHEAEAVLRGTIQSVEIYPVAVDSEFLVLEYGMRVMVSLSLEKQESGEPVWISGAMQEEARYYASAVPADPSDPLLLQANRREAMIRLARKIADRVADRLLAGF
jgi:hypothetical protein